MRLVYVRWCWFWWRAYRVPIDDGKLRFDGAVRCHDGRLDIFGREVPVASRIRERHGSDPGSLHVTTFGLKPDRRDGVVVLVTEVELPCEVLCEHTPATRPSCEAAALPPDEDDCRRAMLV
jgi:hypothetical protein